MIHPTAIIEPGAKIASDVEIGAYSIIGPHVEIGSGTKVGAHAVIKGHTRIGRNNRIYQFVSLGEIPQDKKYAVRAEVDGALVTEGQLMCTLRSVK